MQINLLQNEMNDQRNSDVFQELLDNSIEQQDSFESIKMESQKSIPQIQQIQIQQIPQTGSSSIWSKQMATILFKSTIQKTCSNLKTLKTNLTYNLKHSEYLDIFSKREKLILSPYYGVSLLGKIYKTSAEKQEFYANYNSVIWLTYRSGIYGIESDAGWGCMIRVCQMVLAETFKRIDQQKSLKKIIQYFKDSPEAYFSLTRICQRGDITERWTSSIQIFTILKKLIMQFNKQVTLSVDIYSVFLQIDDLKTLDNQVYPKLIFISNRLGKDKIQTAFRAHLMELMNIDKFIGIIGGNGGQALYLIGNSQGKLIFLDPHYVQNNSQNDENLSTYFSTEPYLIDIDQLASSVAFNFLVKSKQEHLQLLEKLYELQQFYSEGLCIEMFCKQLQKKLKKKQKKKNSSEIFEVL